MLCWPRTNRRHRKNFFGNHLIFEEGVSMLAWGLFSQPWSALLGKLSPGLALLFSGSKHDTFCIDGIFQHRKCLTSASLEEFAAEGGISMSTPVRDEYFGSGLCPLSG